MSDTDRKFTEAGLAWHIVEEAINNEIEWLEKAIQQAVIGRVPGCDDCRYTYRKTALLIVTGKIKAKEFIARDGHDPPTNMLKRLTANTILWLRQVKIGQAEHYVNQRFARTAYQNLDVEFRNVVRHNPDEVEIPCVIKRSRRVRPFPGNTQPFL